MGVDPEATRILFARLGLMEAERALLHARADAEYAERRLREVFAQAPSFEVTVDPATRNELLYGARRHRRRHTVRPTSARTPAGASQD